MKGTVKSKSDVERLFREGRRSSSYLLTALSLPTTNVNNVGRCAFVAGKKLGCAPLRARCKRVMRAASQELGAPWEGTDIVFVAKRKVAHAPHDKVVEDMRRQLTKLGVI